MRCSYYPQSLVQVRGVIREIEVGIWRSWPAGAVHPELPRLHRSDRCSWPVWPVRATCGICLGWTAWLMCLWVLVLLVSSWSVWSWFVMFYVGFSFRAGCVLGVFLFQGLEKSLRLSETLVVRLLWPLAWPALSTGLTDAGHRSDRCSTGSKPCKFPLCVLVCFGPEGCLLVSRSSSTSVAAWAWPTWVVSRRRVLEVVFVLLDSPSPSRRIFIGSHSLPPLWFAVSVLQSYSLNTTYSRSFVSSLA
jgi:hypothetical protein